MTCDLKESEGQTVVRYLGRLNEAIRHVVELQPYSSLDKVSSLAHKVELQEKAKYKKDLPKSPKEDTPLTKGAYPSHYLTHL